jgi:hypothetical protein
MSWLLAMTLRFELDIMAVSKLQLNFDLVKFNRQGR